MQKGTVLLIVLLLVLVVVGSGYFLYSKGYFGARGQPLNKPTGVFDYGTPAPGKTPSPTAQGSQQVGNVTSSKMSLTVISPANGATLNSASVIVTGKTSPRAEVFINDKETRAGADGKFSLKITLDEGQNVVVVMANDEAGNVVEQDISVNIQTF